jgi:hypothetical protein
MEKLEMSSQNQQKQKVTSSKRRALIKGSATAVPMVLTLRSGAAFAAISAVNCASNTQTFLAANPGSAPEVLKEGSDDNWVRVLTTGRIIKIVSFKGGAVPDSYNTTPFSIFKTPGTLDGDPYAKWFKTVKNTSYSFHFVEFVEPPTIPDPTNPTGPEITNPDAGKIRMKNSTDTAAFDITAEDTNCWVLCLVDEFGQALTPATYGAGSNDGTQVFPFATDSCMGSLANATP